MKSLATLVLGIILGIAVFLAWQRGWLPGEDREVDFSELSYRGGIAYAVSPDSKRPEDKPFTGRAIQRYEDRALRLSGEFVAGKPGGLWELWRDNQTLWATVSLTADGFFPEKDNCIYLVNDGGVRSKGKSCLDENFDNINSEGPYQEWHPNGQLRVESTYKDDKVEGLWRSWHENGQLSLEATYKDGKKEGPWRMWFENGQLAMEHTYKDDKVEGLWRSWHENGQLAMEGTSQNDEAEGLTRLWHDNGQLWSEATYKDGKKEGLSRRWDKNGQLWAGETYRDGELVEEE